MRNERCHAERSEASQSREQTLRFAQGDNHSAFFVTAMRRAVVVDAVRTPVGRYGGALNAVRPISQRS